MINDYEQLQYEALRVLVNNLRNHGNYKKAVDEILELVYDTLKTPTKEMDGAVLSAKMNNGKQVLSVLRNANLDINLFWAMWRAGLEASSLNSAKPKNFGRG